MRLNGPQANWMRALDAFREEFCRVEERTDNGDGFNTDGEDVGGEIT